MRIDRPTPRETPVQRVIVVDDDRRMASATAQWLCEQGWHAGAAGTADEAIQSLDRGPLHACVIDAGLPDSGGLRVAAVVRAAWPDAAIVLTIPTGLSPSPALAATADATLPAPARDADLIAALAAAAQARVASPATLGVLGTHPAIRQVLDVATRIADTPATVLITGESEIGRAHV